MTRVPGVEPLSAAQEAVEEAAAAVLIEMAFLVPRGTDLTATVGPKLEAYKAAIEARAALRAERTAAHASGEVQARARELCAKLTGYPCDGCWRCTAIAAALASSMTPQQDVETPGPEGLKAAIDEIEQVMSLCHDKSAIETLRRWWLVYASAHRKHAAGPRLSRRVNELETQLAALARVPPAPQPGLTARVCKACSDALGIGTIVHYNDQPCPREPVPPAPAAQARSAGRVDLEKLADGTVSELLRGYNGDVADRLVLTSEDGRNLGCSWSRVPLRAIILAALQREDGAKQ